MKTRTFSSGFALSLCLGFLLSYSDAVKVRYTRANKNANLGVAQNYYSKYFAYARLSTYTTSKYWSSHTRCGNFEANSEGDYLGFFSCNLDFEPFSFIYCCGQQGSHYCCPNASLNTPYNTNPDKNSNLANTGIGIAIFVGIICGIIVIIRVFYYCHLFNGRRMNPPLNPGTVVFTTASSTADYSRQPYSSPNLPPSGVINESFQPEPFAPPPYPGPEAQPPSYQSVTDGKPPTIVSGDQPPAYFSKES